jgi:uncharacterized protein YodC (DUF2158 family)
MCTPGLYSEQNMMSKATTCMWRSRLKSGGPHMTVVALTPFYITAAYFDNVNRLTDSQFPPEALRPVNTEPIQEPVDTGYVDMAYE